MNLPGFRAVPLPLLLSTLFLHVATTTGWGQESERSRQAERTRPSLGREYRQKRDLRPFLQQAPRPSAFGLYLNSNLIVESVTGGLPQNESSIAIHPTLPEVIIAAAVDARAGAYVYRSTDGGRSWVNINLGTVHPNWQSGNDPSVTWDHLGNGYVMYGAFPTSGRVGQIGESGIYLSRTSDTGATWTKHLVVIEHRGTMTADSAFEDKYYIHADVSAVSPYLGRLYTPWKRVIDRDSSTQIVVSHSTDLGTTWSAPLAVSPRKPHTSLDTTFGQSFPLMRTGPNGEVYVVWNDGPIRSIGFARSSDGGESFTAPTYPVTGYPSLGTARRVGDDVYHVLKGTFRAETYPTLAVDNTGGPRNGWLYLVWAAGRHPDIYFSRSSDQGESWSAPRIIQSDTINDQWWPWIAVDPTNGDIAVMYSDSRNDPENILIDQYVSYSRDGGDTWVDQPVTDYRSDFRKNPYVAQIFAGDYSGIDFRDGVIRPSFLDTRSDNDVFTSIVHVRQPGPVEGLVVAAVPGDFSTARLTWSPLPDTTPFGLPMGERSIIVERDSVPLALLPASATSFEDAGRALDSLYTYSLRVATTTDTSVERSVCYSPQLAAAPLRPAVEGIRQYAPTVEITIRLPRFRADSATPLVNLAGYRVYRDGEMLREVGVPVTDTGSTVVIEDTPPSRGYYRYWVTSYDGATPSLESVPTDTLILYAGPLTPFVESFDAADPRFLTTGAWERTTAIALSQPSSLTDSRDGDYLPRQNTYTQIYPVRRVGEIELTFSQIVIVDAGDSALVEMSGDGGRSWQPLARYSMKDDQAWEDGVASEGDWRPAMLRLPAPASGADTVTVRFRLWTSSLRSADGWYIDDIAFGQVADVRRGDASPGISAEARPNPASGATILHLRHERGMPLRVTLFDLAGRRLLSRDLGDVEAGESMIPLDLTSLEEGAYWYVVEGGGGVARGRLVVMRPGR